MLFHSLEQLLDLLGTLADVLGHQLKEPRCGDGLARTTTAGTVLVHHLRNYL